LRRIGFSCVAALLMARGVHAGTIPDYILEAVADSSRPNTDRDRDAGRKPAEVIAFAGIKPGDKVADFMPGGGYFTRLFCKVVGNTGHVYAIAVAPSLPDGTPLLAEPPGHACTNVTASSLQNVPRPAPELWSSSDDPGMVYEYWSFIPGAERFSAPEPLDLIWTSENYHDLRSERFGPPNMELVHKALLKALRPGGILMIMDHAAVSRSGAGRTQAVHRIDARQIKKEVIAAGFVFVGESKVLRNVRDLPTAEAHERHDGSDRFLLKFRKP